MEKCIVPGTPEQYAAAFKRLLGEGWELERLNKGNHVALENGYITMEYFKAAAEVLKAEILKR